MLKIIKIIMGVSDMTSLIEAYGFKGAIFSIVLFLLVSMFKSKWFANFLSRISDKFIERFMKNKTKENQVRNINDSDISNHDIFNYIDFWMYSKVPTFQFSTEYRTVVFRKYLTIYLKSYKSNISKFILNKDYQEMDEAKLSTTLLNLINRIVYDYEREMEEAGIPKVVIEKMKVKNNDTITLTIDLIEGICSSQFYSSDKNYLKVYSILNILLSVLENTISNSENVCNSINGQLKGLSFTDSGKIYKEP
jgi:hypothetical protein